MADPTDQVRDHAFDGIQEYDNDLPRWWLMLFYATIVWAVLYCLYYHVLGVPVGASRWQAEAEAERERARATAVAAPTEDFLRQQLADPTQVTRGAEVYRAQGCAQCHGPDGATGPIGPNLTDRFWKHGNRMLDMNNVIQNGAGVMQPQRMPAADRIALIVWLVHNNKQGARPGMKPMPGEVEAPIDY